MGQIRADLQLNCERFLGSIHTVSEAVEGLEHKVLAFAGAFEGLKIGAELVSEQFEHLHEALELGDKMNDLQANTGQTITDLTVLRQAFANAGLGADGVQPALKNLAKALTGINEDGEPTKEVFEKLGVSINALRDMSAVQQITTLQAAFKGIPNPADRAKAAMDLFGKAGGQMLALLSEDEALTTASRQVGGLGETLQANAKTFDSISDAIGALHLKFDQFYTGLASGVADDAESFFKDLSEMDFTSAGESAGQLAGGVAHLVEMLSALKPIIVGVVASMIAFELRGRLGATVFNTTLTSAMAKSTLSMAYFVARVRTAEVSVASFSAVARTAFAGVRTAAGGLVNLLGGPIGVAVAGLTTGFEIYMRRVEKAKAATRGLKDVLDDMERHNGADFATIKNVSSEDERVEAMKKLEEELEEVHKRMGRVDEDYENLNDEGRAGIVQQFERWASNVEALKKKLAEIPPEILAQREAQKKINEATEEAKKKVDELEKSYAKLKEEKRKASLEELPPEVQEQVLLRSVGKGGAGGLKFLDDSIELLERNMRERKQLEEGGESKYVLDLQQERLEKMLEIRHELVAVEKRITEERKRQADQADEEAKKQAEAKKKLDDFNRKSALDLAKLQAQGRGDAREEDRIDRIQRYDQAFEEAANAGQGTVQADIFARQKVAAQDAAKAEQEREKEKAPEAKLSIFADSDRRVGLGGQAFATREDPLVKAHQDSTRATQQLKGSIDTLNKQLQQKPERIVVPGKAYFQ